MVVNESEDGLVNMKGDTLNVMMMKMLSAIIITQHALIIEGQINGECRVEGSSLTFS